MKAPRLFHRRAVTPGFILCLLLLVGLDPNAGAQSPPVGAEKAVLDLFEKRCASCHFEGERNGRKGKKPALHAGTSLTALRRDESYVVPGKAADSPLFRLVVLPEDHDDRMPQNRKAKGETGYVPPLAPTEVAVLRQWIEAGGSGADGGRRFVSDVEILRLVGNDLEKLPAEERGGVRYLSLHHLRNLPAAVESEADLEIYRAALSKLINSLSWQPRIVRPVAVDPDRTLFRVRLADYGWTPAMWHRLSSVYPYGLTRLGLDEWKVARLLGVDDAPFLRGDWFVFASSQAPLYHELLYGAGLPPGFTEQHLERYLQFDSVKNIRDTATGMTRRGDGLPVVVRAGFKKSGVSQANRLIERHALADGRGYWKSYDFATGDSDPERDLFLSPLGPPEAKLSTDYAFAHDGGEIIFHLPNGLQGYLLTTAEGKVLGRAPENIVQDSNRRDRTILNGISCMKCHDQGTKNPVDGVKDDVKAVALSSLGQALSPGERQAIERLYSGRNVLEEALNTDSARFLKALVQAGASGLAVEPVAHLYERFKADLKADKLASEFSLDESQLPGPLARILADSHDPAVRVAANLSQIGLPRREFIPRFQAIVAEFRLGQIREFQDNPYEEFGQPAVAAPPKPANPRRTRILPNRIPSPTVVARVAGGFGEGQPYTVPDLGLRLLWVASGTFVMGRPANESDRSSDEGPQTTVRLSRGFWLGQHEVTQAEWQSVMGNNPSGFSGNARHPVEKVSWEDCQEFLKKLNDRERAAGRLPAGFAYRLPTEAEWEFACRAGTTGAFAGTLDAMGWYDGNSGSKTHPVGEKQANAWGFHDMHGNVWEWCADWYADKLPGGSVTDPKGVASGSFRVFRGGGWCFSAAFCRSAFRDRVSPGYRVNILGFRLALSSVQ